MMMVVAVEEVYVEALQFKYPIIDWEDMLKIFDRVDLVIVWNLIKERFSSTEPIDDKERTFWVELKRNMNLVATQQVALDNSLVPPEKRLKIEKCNARIAFSKPKREETYQVTLDALKLSPCYPTFMITTEVPEVYMHQFWNTIQKVKDTDAYRFKLDKKNLGEHLLQSSIGASLGKQQDLINSRNHELKSCRYGALIPDDMINQNIKDSKAYKTYYDFATGKATPKKARKYKKVASPSRKLSPVLDTLCESVSKKKTPAKVDRGIGMDLLSDVALLKAAQVKEALKKSKKDSHMLHASGSGYGVGSQPKVLDESEDKTTGTDEGTCTKPGVLDVPKYLSESKNKSCGDSGDDGSNDVDSDDVTKNDDENDVEIDAYEDKEASDSEKIDFDEDKNLNVNQNDNEEEYVRTPDSFEFNDDEEEYDELYKDVNVRSKVVEHEEIEKGDAKMTDTTHKSASQEKSYEQVIKDAHVTLTSS
ncbi:hypothetical protein Tco_0253033 [Tanacetum coccineum]